MKDPWAISDEDRRDHARLREIARRDDLEQDVRSIFAEAQSQIVVKVEGRVLQGHPGFRATLSPF